MIVSKMTRVQANGVLETSFAAHSEETVVYTFEDVSDTGKKGSACDACMSRIPHATVIATIMCLLGVGVFCGTMHRGSTLAVLMFDNVFQLQLFWVEAIQIIFVVIGASMAALGFIILFVGCLATGATRRTVYRAWSSRVSGRISCAVFMGITYVLQIAWLFMFCFLSIVTFVFTMFWNMCSRPNLEQTCIDFQQFDFLFPSNIRVDQMKVCDHKIKLFCKDYVEKAEWMFILATFASVLVILSLVHYLMCLAANYAHIRGHTKFQELQDLQSLNDPDMAMSKDRF